MSVNEANRRPEYDVLQPARTNGGWLVILHLKAYGPDGDIELISQWDGMLHPIGTNMDKLLGDKAQKHDITDDNCRRDLLENIDPLAPHKIRLDLTH